MSATANLDRIMPDLHFFPPVFIAPVEINFGARFAATLVATVEALTRPPRDGDLTAMRALLQDLETIRACRGPTSQVLALAPHLIDWCFLISPDGLRLTGKVVGHPVLGARERIATSPICAIASKQHGNAWARWFNRYYRSDAARVSDDLRRRTPRFH
jgi:hypothetical protein